MRSDIKSLIEKYAQVYEDFEVLQKSGILPNGDQKTGVIAEYYAKCYTDKTFKVESEYAKPGECFDLSYTKDKKKFKIQVKAVSVHSKTRIMAPLNLEEIIDEKPFDFLYLISLDKDFRPDGFYINSFDDIKQRLKAKNDGRKRIQGAAMRGDYKNGYWLFDFENNLASELNKIINN